MKKITVLQVAIMCILLTNCVTTKFSEKITDPDGSVSETVYKANSSAYPFGKLSLANHSWSYKWGVDSMPNEINTGMNAQGIDNTGMVALADLISKIVVEGIKAYMALPVTPETPSILPQIIDSLVPLLKK